jgi:predicted nucleic acid-binding protein
MSVGPAVGDTDVASFLFKGETRGAPYQSTLACYVPAISFMNLAELNYWALRRRWGPATVARLEAFLTQFAVIPPDHDLCQLWAEVTNACRKVGRPIQAADAWVAATALHLGAPLLTHNRSDFVAVPRLSVISAP